MIFDFAYELVHGVQHGLASYCPYCWDGTGAPLKRVIWFDTDTLTAVCYTPEKGGHVVKAAGYAFVGPEGSEEHRQKLLACLPATQHCHVPLGKTGLQAMVDQSIGYKP
jgi:hypothetical protein